MAMHWYFENIPSEEINNVLDLYENKKYTQLAIKFTQWGVIPVGCGSCGVVHEIDGYMQYAIHHKLIERRE